MNGERIAAAMRQPVILAVIWICALLLLIGTLTKMPDQWHRRDFSNYYESAWAMRHGIDPYSTNLTLIGAQLGLETNWLVHASQTPPFLLCFEPLTRMRPRVAFWIWIAINFSALTIAMYLLLMPRRGLSGRTALLLVGLMLMSAPVNLNFYWGQSQLIVLALMVAAMRAMERDHDGAAGLLIAAAALLRAYPVLLVGYLVLRRKWRAVIFAMAGIAAGGFATLAILGLPQTLSFIHGALWLTDYRVVSPVDNLSLGPFVSRMFWSLTSTAPGSSADWVRRAAIATADVVVLGLTIRATLVDSDRRDPDWRIYSLWIATAVMLTPVGWHHYLVLLAIPFVQIVASATEDRSNSRAIWMAALAYFLSAISLRAFSRFMVPPPTAFQLALPWLARALEETSFVALLTGYISAYWFATDQVRVPMTDVAPVSAADSRLHGQENYRLKPVPPKSIAIV
ncbi:glycosyltransferase family 87 protein [Candidatus Binatus sp.]|uniref:glycosyltransferase family 87 protein n=1 Tax=Candidatus Binatus sp. TaxID=2811406 RepID=UPI003BB15E4B